MKHEYGVDLIAGEPRRNAYGAVVLAVAHKEFRELDVRGLVKPDGVVFDVKSILDPSIVDGRL